MHDVLYTKAAIAYSRLGIVLRCITVICSFSALVVFSTIIDTHVYPLTDISKTYFLPVEAVLLELYALILNYELHVDDLKEFLKGEGHSMLKYGLMVSKKLQNVHQRKWEMISDIWVEMLIYAAHNCEWKEHAQQLTGGGEILIHVCLLMSHFGLIRQYVSTNLFSLTPEMVLVGGNSTRRIYYTAA